MWLEAQKRGEIWEEPEPSEETKKEKYEHSTRGANASRNKKKRGHGWLREKRGRKS